MTPKESSVTDALEHLREVLEYDCPTGAIDKRMLAAVLAMHSTRPVDGDGQEGLRDKCPVCGGKTLVSYSPCSFQCAEALAKQPSPDLPSLGSVDEVERLRVAKALNGPHLPPSVGSQFSLEHLRDVRWKMLSEQEQGLFLEQADAAIAALQATPLTKDKANG